MSDSGDNVKYKWTPDSTSLLVSIWSDRQVQKQLEYTSKPQLIWESVARYMKKKGYNVSAKQCRSRMKQVLVCYREAKRAGTRAGVEQYYESIDRVLKNKRLDENINGIDTVDAAINVKSPPKDVKTNRNLQMRHKFQEPVQSLHRTEALSPTWGLGRENEYPDSPESNETIIARPYRVFSPTRDVAINTGDQLIQIAGKSTQCNGIGMEEPLLASYKQNLNYPYGEVPFQNTVQNVQNHIIQENMQQNCMSNQQHMLVNNLGFQPNMHNLNQNFAMQSVNVPVKISPLTGQNPSLEQLMQQQNHLQQMTQVNNRAMPQEPRKVMFGQNLAATYKQQYGNILTHMPAVVDTKEGGCLSPNYSPDVSQNLNEAFCQAKNSDKTHNLGETYNQGTQVENPLLNQNVSVITNNATCNDDTLLLEFLMDSLSQSENDNRSKDTAVNTDNIPNVPIRKKKAQKLEQLVLSAISSQNDVVNKILAAQNDMLTKFLDLDRDRQNRLESRLDDLVKVVHTTVLTKQSSDADIEIPPSPEPIITSLVPPPRPGAPPPKLDLVPPKPCRVPCTVPNSNIELINQNTVTTRPGVVSPITSPVKKPGTIWSKLGPVSQSPFVKAQQRLGFQVASTTDTRTQSSAERRIAREVDKIHMDTETLKFETKRFLDMEKQLEEMMENARLEASISQTLHARRRLFTQREPTAAMILTTAFLENECRAAEQAMSYSDVVDVNKGNLRNIDDDLLTGQGEGYEHLRHLNIQPACVPGEPCDTSTPAKFGTVSGNNERTSVAAPKQTIQQLAQLVMNTGRWKDFKVQHEQQNRVQHIPANVQGQQNLGPSGYSETVTTVQQNVCPTGYSETVPTVQPTAPSRESQMNVGKSYVREWMLNKCGDPVAEPKPVYGPSYNTINKKPNLPIGFTRTMLDTEHPRRRETNGGVRKSIGLNGNAMPDRKQQTVRFMDEALAELQRMYIERMSKDQQEKNDSLPYVVGNGNNISTQNRQMIETYMNDIMPKRQLRDGKDRNTDSDNDDEFLDTTTTMPMIEPRRGSLTSTGTGSTETAHSIKLAKDNCVIS
ncbi:PREDICTED: uncharacterized protein LOC107185577 [Dufourea novaeangliae]|uniref:Myb/SANT-like DNA-binding domain-containing protein n=1 Tax=Dufourea novaeangliae TaxID=178035 RepID=A0A154P5W0_DUFNO|nr:PREDICTED: uncharacterized protein LOC107185577 [Dufourea novaeangliae]KZC07242.1 hypothetical protein WN55_07653 [Dufourea novaeangliae]